MLLLFPCYVTSDFELDSILVKIVNTSSITIKVFLKHINENVTKVWILHT